MCQVCTPLIKYKEWKRFVFLFRNLGLNAHCRSLLCDECKTLLEIVLSLISSNLDVYYHLEKLLLLTTNFLDLVKTFYFQILGGKVNYGRLLVFASIFFRAAVLNLGDSLETVCHYLTQNITWGGLFEQPNFKAPGGTFWLSL